MVELIEKGINERAVNIYSRAPKSKLYYMVTSIFCTSYIGIFLTRELSMLCVFSSVCWLVMGEYHTLGSLQPLLPHKVGVPAYQKSEEVLSGLQTLLYAPAKCMCMRKKKALIHGRVWELRK